jgi:hypothetical protein
MAVKDLKKAESWDQPAVFALAVIMVVVGGIAFLSWGASSLHLTGLLGLLKGGVVQ